jgi:hypothetical protein
MKFPHSRVDSPRNFNASVRRLGSISCLLLSMTILPTAWAEDLRIEVAAGEYARRQTPVHVAIELASAHAERTAVALIAEDGSRLAGQLTAPGVLANKTQPQPGQVIRELHFVLPHLAANQTVEYRLDLESPPDGDSFQWKDNEGHYSELRWGDRPVLRYMYRALDESTPQDRFLTYKVFHHLFDPTGKRLVTNGPDGEHTYEFDDILFPHHRGIFYGFNRCSYRDVDRADVWHCQGDDHQSHVGLLQSDVGPVLGRHRVAVGWHGKGKQEFIREHRELTAYHVPGGQLIEFASRAKSLVGPVKLDGDPQHAGFQFRAHNEVAAETKEQTYYVRVDGPGKPGETRNWPQDTTEVDLPWKGLSFVVGDQRYTATYLDMPTNPKEARFSERDYGRFGSYFVHELDEIRPLEVRYRLWLQEGEMTPDEITALHRDLVDPPSVRVLR